MTQPIQAQPPPKSITARGRTRIVQARLVEWRCEWCSQERTTWQYPGPPPRYCPECKEEAQQAMNTARQREKRQRQLEANPWGRARPGRPVGSKKRESHKG